MASPRSELHLKYSDQLIKAFIGVTFFSLEMDYFEYQMSVFFRRFQKYKVL
jgi:hypothetical protein